MDTLFEWTQGLRPARTDYVHPMAWQEILFRRLTGDHSAAPAGEKTGRAELALDLGRNVYFSVGRVLPDFGFQAVAHNPQIRVAQVVLKSSPFDTGGLIAGKIPLRRELSPDDLKQTIASNTYADLEYLTPMKNWINASFDSAADYVLGHRPRTSTVDIIDMAKSDEPAWSWEGRIIAEDYQEPPLMPVRLFIRHDDYHFYTKWVEHSSYLLDDEYFEHLDFLEDIVRTVDDPVKSMKEFLCKETPE
ncbi:hypothetical protein PV772_17110 [Pseudarthrobacter sp. CC12]|uniref:hypothetical protein n=1 Tax=Pseudarthrobacter sp. CC12 TaxID=3029193 RepID=UPI003267DED4